MKKVMIIDDSEADQFLACALLKKKIPDVEIVQAYDGKEALEILSEIDEDPEIIFLDINMPRMNGHEFLYEYSKTSKNIHVIIMLTSSDQEKDKTKSQAYKSVKLYLVKPMDEIKFESISSIL